ncbi:MAG: AMP-binding protein [Ilumatobacteraceae bacterium]
MMYIGDSAEKYPDTIAMVIDDGVEEITYAQLDEQSNALAHAFAGLGLTAGDTVAAILPNGIRYGIVWWAAMRSGMYITPINWHLTSSEVRYIIVNSEARAVITSAATAAAADEAMAGLDEVHRIHVGASAEGRTTALDFDALVAENPTSRIARELAGAPMYYSSGTTGRPKGVKPPLSGLRPDEFSTVSNLIMTTFGIGHGDRYLSPAPLYHSAPSSWSFGAHTVGATAVVMSKFDAATALHLLDSQRITVSQWVPTMFQRMLRLPAETRAAYRGEVHRAAYHAAAPCPTSVKKEMIEWWGPILFEFYAATEGGATQIDSHEWLQRPGSVGRHWTGGTIHILDLDDRHELGPNADGLIYFEPFAANKFEYHDDPDKTAAAYHGGLVTAGDIGYLDDDGYLFLTDRLSNMIISGGVNIYPMEIENHLASHPAVIDVAVFGIPNDEFGEEVKAVVQVAPDRIGDDLLKDDLMAHCRVALAAFKCPRSIDLVTELPRDDNGKLYKRLLRDAYWQGRESRLV